MAPNPNRLQGNHHLHPCRPPDLEGKTWPTVKVTYTIRPYGEFINDISSTPKIYESWGARAISLRPLTTDARFHPGPVYVGFVMDKVTTGQDASPSTSVFAHQYHSPRAQNRCHSSTINPLKTKCRQLYLKTQFVPRSKHFSSWLEEPISLCCNGHKSPFVLR